MIWSCWIYKIIDLDRDLPLRVPYTHHVHHDIHHTHTSEENHFSESVAPNEFGNSLIWNEWKPREAPFDFFGQRQLAIFSKRDINSASGKKIRFSFSMFLVAKLPQKDVFSFTRIHSLLVNGVVTASSHANRDKFSNCDIYIKCLDVLSFLWTSERFLTEFMISSRLHGRLDVD